MPLIGNRSVLLKSPGRWLNGGQGIMRSAFSQHGMERNAFSSFDALSSIPAGCRSPVSWVMAKTSGGMASHNDCSVGLEGSATGAEGYGIAGVAAMSIESSGLGGLIAGGVGTASISISSSGAVTATIGSTGTASISLSGSANIGAIGWVVGTAPVSVSGSLIPYAKGHMAGTTADLGLSVAGITNAVWSAPLAGYSAVGTAGKALAAASSGGVDYEALGLAVWTSVTRTLTTSNGVAPTASEVADAVWAKVLP